jgi:putative oxidoreductase
MLTNLAKNHLAPLLLRLGLAVIFLYHGSHKIVEGVGAEWSNDLPIYVQIPVAWGELLAGVALLLGVLTRLAAAGIIVIMAGAIATTTWENGFSILNRGYEYNFAIIVMGVVLILLGPGALAGDHCLWRWRKKPVAT